jgi:hypothetical protein
VQVNGYPIDEYTYQKAPAAVTYTLEFEMQTARVEMGLSMQEFDALPGNTCWVDMDNPTLSKSDVLMIYRRNRAIPAVMSDAQSREMQKKRRPR